jgi:putative Ca2+/H+ antiporter (TMEM165/GDT1 family)
MRVLIMTFCLVFLAELGDKTQLATMLMAAKSKSIWAVFLGSALALVASSFIGVLAGGIITKYVPQNYIQIASGIAFIVIGILLVSRKI